MLLSVFISVVISSKWYFVSSFVLSFLILPFISYGLIVTIPLFVPLSPTYERVWERVCVRVDSHCFYSCLFLSCFPSSACTHTTVKLFYLWNSTNKTRANLFNYPLLLSLILLLLILLLLLVSVSIYPSIQFYLLDNYCVGTQRSHIHRRTCLYCINYIIEKMTFLFISLSHSPDTYFSWDRLNQLS